MVQGEEGEQEIPVHRMLLEARSPFFRGMLESNMAEAQQGRYVIRDMIPPVVKALLHFIYTGGLLGSDGELCAPHLASCDCSTSCLL